MNQKVEGSNPSEPAFFLFDGAERKENRVLSASNSYRAMERTLLQRLWSCIGALFDNTALKAVERFWMNRDIDVLLDRIV